MSEFFLQRYQKMVPDVVLERPELRQALRVNTSVISDEKLVASLKYEGVKIEKIPFLKNGYYVYADFSLGSTKEYLLGQYFLQGPLSQLVSEMLAPGPDDTVLDLASAPGGKATHLAAMAKQVVALDNQPDRLKTVRNNVERLGCTNVICMLKDARYATDLEQEFSHILLDAPCAGNFCQDENWFAKRTVEGFKQNARLQRELIRAAYRCLAPGGKLVYSTCSLEPEEDELMIDWLLEKFDDLSVVPIEVDFGDEGVTEWDGKKLNADIKHTRKFWPHKTGMEGFYIAVIEKSV